MLYTCYPYASIPYIYMQVLYKLEIHVIGLWCRHTSPICQSGCMYVCGMLFLSCALLTRQFISPHTRTSTSRNSLQHAETQRQESGSHTEWSRSLTHQSAPTLLPLLVRPSQRLTGALPLALPQSAPEELVGKAQCLLSHVKTPLGLQH